MGTEKSDSRGYNTLISLAAIVGIGAYTAVKYSGAVPGFYIELFILLNLAIYRVTLYGIGVFKDIAIKNDIFGMDINKRGTPGGEIKIPETCGTICAVAFICLSCLVSPFVSYIGQSGKEISDLLSTSYMIISYTVFLGFADDVLDLRWRLKLIFPLIFSIPIAMNFKGDPRVMLPYPLSLISHYLWDLVPMYYAFLAMLSIFCTNAINIYAGINGLEVGQSIGIGIGILVFNIYFIFTAKAQEVINNQLISIILIVPFITTSFALLKLNKYIGRLM